MIEAGVRLVGNVLLGADVSIAAPAELMARDSLIQIGEGTDVAAFVTISTADSHARCIGHAGEIERLPIVIEDHVFIGTGAVILGGCHIGHHSVIGAGVVLKGAIVSPHSRVLAPAPTIQAGYYSNDTKTSTYALMRQAMRRTPRG